jgi:hypothetical protein
MCGGGGSSTTTTSEVPDFVKKGAKAARQSAQAYQKKYGVTTPAEQALYARLGQNADTAESYMPYQQALIGNLYTGGGMGQGAQYINGDVADRFANAGRSFSGAEAGAFGDAATKAALPMLMGQYNTNVGEQQAAAAGLLGSAGQTATGLDTTQGNVLKAQMAAPQQISNLNIPENLMLSVEDRKRKAAYDAAMLQVSAMSGTPGMGSTSTTTQSTNPFQTLVGGGLGLLGAFM